MEIIRILSIFRQADNWAIPRLRQAHAILVSALFILLILVFVGFIFNINGYMSINIFLGTLGIIGIAINAVHPGITLRVFETGMAAGIPDPTKGFWQGGEDFLKTYARCVKLILFYYSLAFFVLGLVPFAENEKVFWVLLLGILLLSLWPKET